MSRCTLATLFGVGLVGKAPGTAGSLVAALLAWPILMLPFGWCVLAAGVVVFTWLGTRSAGRYMVENHCAHDPGEVVVDELAGQSQVEDQRQPAAGRRHGDPQRPPARCRGCGRHLPAGDMRLHAAELQRLHVAARATADG